MPAIARTSRRLMTARWRSRPTFSGTIWRAMGFRVGEHPRSSQNAKGESHASPFGSEKRRDGQQSSNGRPGSGLRHCHDEFCQPCRKRLRRDVEREGYGRTATAVITWNTGWTTKIAKEDDHWKKT